MTDPTKPPADDRSDELDPFRGAESAPDARTFWQKLEANLANLADVTVATVISNVTVDLDARGRLTKVTAKDEQVAALITNVNLIDGNVTNVIGEDIKDDTALTTFHQGIVEKAVKVLPDNIKALFTLVEGIVKPNK
jgi:hypothetical protein